MKFKLATMAAAMFGAASAAQAADLGRPAPAAVDYVKVCDAYGAGFFYIPGGETCLKISGYVRAEVKGGDSDAYATVGGVDFLVGTYSGRYSNTDQFRSRARALLDIDARTNTEFGLLRSMIEVYWTFDSNNGAPATSLDLAYIQWGGLTAGRAQSFYDFFTGYAYNFQAGEIASDAKVNLLAYTFAFGNGFTATLSLEDATTGRRRGVGLAVGPLGVPGNQYGGNWYPDIVGALKVSQAWGSAQLSGAAHSVNTLNGTVPPGIGSSDEWGYAVQAGVEILLPMIAPGDKFAIQAAYGKGATSYVNGNDGFIGGVLGTQAIGVDAVIDATGRTRLTEAYAVFAGFSHNFSPAWQLDVNGGVYSVDGFGARDFTQWEVGGDIRWKPVAGLSIGVGIDYRDVTFTNATKAAFAPVALRDAGAWTVGARIQRNF